MRRAGPFAYAGMVVIAAIYGIPFLSLVTTSLKTNTQIFAGGLFFTPTIDAYRNVVNGDLLQACLNSAIIGLSTTVLTIALATPAAYALARLRGSLVNAGLAIVIILQMMPQPATLIPLYRVLAGWYLLDTPVGVILADTALLLPFCILILRPFFLAVPREIEEQGRMDGANGWRIFSRLVVPVTLNGVLTGGTIIFFIAWGEFLYAITFLPDASKYPISVLIASQVSQYGIEWSQMMAIAVVASLPILAIYAFTYRRLRDGLSLGSVR